MKKLAGFTIFVVLLFAFSGIASAADGACCFPDGSCAVSAEGDCATGGGLYQGDETTCDPNPCPEIEILTGYVSGGWGPGETNFYAGKKAPFNTITYNIFYRISGGLPDAMYKVKGKATAKYGSECSKKKKRARGSKTVGEGLHTLTFDKKVPGCAAKGQPRQHWVDVSLSITLMNEEGTEELDEAKNDYGEMFTVQKY